MPDLTLYTNLGAKHIAELVQADEALSKIRLFDDTLNLTPATTKAEMVAAEVGFTGYPAGGETLTAFGDPILAPEGGYSIQSPLVQFIVGSPVVTTALVGGWWVETAAGDVVMASQFESPKPMQVADQGLPISVRQLFPN